MNSIIRINDLDNAFDLLYRHNQEIGRSIGEDELVNGIRKFLQHGNVFAMVVNNRIIAMLNVYCNDFETGQAYINNVYVLPEYRGIHLAQALIKQAILYCQESGFFVVCLHVSEDNVAAVKTYRALGFTFTDNTKDGSREMRLILPKST